jgi:hypothetical protein
MRSPARHFQSDRRGGSSLEYIFAILFIVAGVLVIGQSKGTGVVEHLSRVLTTLLPSGFDPYASGVPSSGCGGFGSGCPVRVTDNPIGIPGVGGNMSGGAAFVVSASPNGG